MTPRERVLAALQHDVPDRCPFQASFTPEFAARLRTDMRLDDRSDHNPHGGGNTYELERALDEDMLLTSVGWANSYYRGDKYVDEWGIGWRDIAYETPYGTGKYTEIATHPLADAAALQSYRPPDPDAAGLYDDAARVVREYGREYWVVGVTVTTIFETAWALRGLSRLLVDFVDDPDLAEAILEIPFRFHLAAAKKLTGLGVDMIWTGDDVGAQSAMIISPAMWRRFFKPRMARFFAEVRAVNPRVKLAYHSDGYIEPIIPDLIEIGLDVLNPVQPGSMDPAKLKRLYGQRLSFWGSIDVQRTLPFGTPADVRREVEMRLRTLGRGGGLVVGPTHHVQLDTPLENFWAMIDAIKHTPGV